MAPRLWVDVEDLGQFLDRREGRPTGIQRLTFELCRALPAVAPTAAFLRHGTDPNGFIEIPWQTIADAFAHAAEDPAPPIPEPPSEPHRPQAVPPRPWRRTTDRLPVPLAEFVRAQWRALLAWPRLLIAGARCLAPARRPAANAPVFVDQTPPPPPAAAPPFAVGDVLLAPGAAWVHRGYAERIAGVTARHGLRFALVVYDIIPLRHPEWCNRSHTVPFATWLRAMLPLADHILAISRYTTDDIARYAAEQGIALRSAPAAFPLGAGFSTGRDTPPQPGHAPPDRDFVLFVSTIEIRKNHGLLLRVWRRLLATMPRSEVPLLVFAGRVGWLVRDLMAQLENSAFLDGHVRVIDDATDNELQALYGACLFTIFPSLTEGWGLPVTESLAAGVPCLASNRTSVPEAGGRFARYFDPEDVAAATDTIASTIRDRAGLLAWRREIRDHFRPPTWEDTARAVARQTRTLPESQPRPDQSAASAT